MWIIWIELDLQYLYPQTKLQTHFTKGIIVNGIVSGWFQKKSCNALFTFYGWFDLIKLLQ